MSSVEDYLGDVLSELLETAKEAKARAAELRPQGHDASAFEEGRALAYYEVVSLLTSQLDVFGISRKAVGLPADFDVEAELL